MTIPEGRARIEAQDMAKLHPSTWEEECRWQTIRAQQAIDEAKALRARVAELEVALKGMVGGRIYAPGLGMIESNESRTARAAL